MSDLPFRLQVLVARTHDLVADLRRALLAASDEPTRALAQDLPTLRDSESGQPPLTIAFVGQYDAGKSTILRALAGRMDIPVDADVCTDRVAAYDWRGVRLLDTPGVRAGFASHDEATQAAVDQADLLVFVVTNELFDDVTAAHFRSLAFEQHRAREMLLVVNKMSQDPGGPEQKLPNLRAVVEPLTPEDLRAVFIDALMHLEALDEADPQDRTELFELGGFEAFPAALDVFCASRKIAGRLTSPLVVVRATAAHARGLANTDDPLEQEAMELLRRKRALLQASRARLSRKVDGIAQSAWTDIGAFGDAVAEGIEPGATKEDLEARHADAQASAQRRSEALRDDSREAIDSELADLQKELEALASGPLAQRLRAASERGRVEDVNVDASADWTGGDVRNGAGWTRPAATVGKVAKEVGTFFFARASGPAAASARVGSASAARGSELHSAVYGIGKLFGVRFKPWGAVKVARYLGNAGRVLSAAAGVLAVVSQIAEDRQQEKMRVDLRNARDGVRRAYRDAGRDVETQLRAQLATFTERFYDAEFADVDRLFGELTGEREERSDLAAELRSIEASARQLMDEIHQYDGSASEAEPAHV